jgi:hypothetical protein
VEHATDGGPVIRIEQVIRRMRGGSQAHLVKGEDSQFYVAKFAGNPQGTRTLINERIAGWLMGKIGISVAPIVLLTLSERILSLEQPYFCVGSRHVAVKRGIHLGCRCPVNPCTTVIFDILPLSLYPLVENLSDFVFAYAFDRWISQTDVRQAIFVRKKGGGSGLRFRAYMIDHGHSFSGAHWAFWDTPRRELFTQKRAYSLLDIKGICENAVDRIRGLPERDILSALNLIPANWLCGDEGTLVIQLLESLCRRRERLSSLIEADLQNLAAEKTGCA